MKTYVSDRKWVLLKRFPTYFDCQPGRLHGFPVSIRRILIPPQLTARRTCVSNSLMLRHSSRCRRLTAQEPVQPWSSSTSKKHTRAFTMCYSTLLSHAVFPHSFHLLNALCIHTLTEQRKIITSIKLRAEAVSILREASQTYDY